MEGTNSKEFCAHLRKYNSQVMLRQHHHFDIDVVIQSDHTMPIEQIVVMGVVITGVLAYSILQSRKAMKIGAAQLASIGPGLQSLHAGFASTRLANESEPVCVVAYHYNKRIVEFVFVGVTNQRILVIKDAGQLYQFPYDYEGEHLPNVQKNKEKRGFFFWKHDDKLPDGRSAYTPTVKLFPPFTKEEWHMYPEVPGHPQQFENLREFSSIFYFKWFY